MAPGEGDHAPVNNPNEIHWLGSFKKKKDGSRSGGRMKKEIDQRKQIQWEQENNGSDS